MTEDPVYIESSGPVTTIVINRPHCRNAVDKDIALALADAFRSFENNAESKVAVLWGRGGNFCAGADLKAFAEGKGNRVEETGDGPMGPTRMVLRKPVIAAIDGYAVAGGLELAIWCDLRVMAKDATLGVYCRRFGVPLIDGGSFRLPRLIGMGRALDLILTGRSVYAEEALAMGLVSRVVPPGQTKIAAEELAKQISCFPSEAMLGDRRSAYEQWGMSEREALDNELRHGRPALREGLEGARRFTGGAGRSGAPE